MARDGAAHPPAAPLGRALARRSIRESRWFARLEALAGVISLTSATVRALVTRPFTWRREFVEQCWWMAAICTAPVVIATALFNLTFNITGGQVTVLLGFEDRISALNANASVREQAPFVVGIVSAGVVGTSICADLGARKVREELDAMRTLAIDPVRHLLAPRFLALGLVTMLLAPIGYLAASLVSLVTSSLWYDVEPGAFFASMGANFTLVELVASLIKCALFGFVIAAIFLHAGVTASGGSEGVGRAVNRAVVAVFLALFVINLAFNATMLGAFPELQDLR